MVERLEAIGYVSGSTPAPPTRGVSIHDGERAFGGLNFYGQRRVDLRRDASGLREYLDGGGRVIATKARHLDRLGDLEGELVEVARFRSGRRAYVLLAPAELSDASARRDP